MTFLSDNHAKVLRIALRKQTIKDAGYKYADFGLTATVYKAVNEQKVLPKVRRKIARKISRRLGKKVDEIMVELWPDSNIRRVSGKRNTVAGR